MSVSPLDCKTYESRGSTCYVTSLTAEPVQNGPIWFDGVLR